MARNSTITINAKEFIANLDKVKKGYNNDILTKLSESADNIRMNAYDKYMLPTNKNRSRVSPTKLTSRTGILKDLLTKKGQWTKGQTIRKLSASKYLNFWIRPQKKGNSFEYLMNLAIVPKGDPKIKYRLDHETKGSPKGKIKRPFFEPAVMGERRNLDSNIKQAVDKMRTA